MACTRGLVLFLIICSTFSGGQCRFRKSRTGPPRLPYKTLSNSRPTLSRSELITKCKVYSRDATLDHFSWVSDRLLSVLQIREIQHVSGVAFQVVYCCLRIPLQPIRFRCTCRSSCPTCFQNGMSVYPSECEKILKSMGMTQATPPENRTSFMQRYFLCDDHWKSHKDGTRGPIFFYVGNEADVTL